jgi:glutathione synthase/RimK-type ligase-like ATP-grasp enzyme
MKRVYIHAARASGGAATLCQALRVAGIKARRLRGGMPPRLPRPIINWGDSSILSSDATPLVVNKPEAVALAISKLSTIKKLEEAKLPVVRVTDDYEKALGWYTRGHGVLARRDGLSNGRGIVCWSESEKPKSDFYSRYWPKSHEYRVHVFNGQPIDLIEKRARRDSNSDRVIRSHDNGWVFSHNLSLTEQVDRDTINQLALGAIRALKLDFGAVDILAGLTTKIPRRLSKAVICEVNTSPGLENTDTVFAYVSAIANMEA